MIDCLRRELLYSEKRPRDILFQAVERILAAEAGAMILSRLTREAAILAKQDAESSGFEFTNWDTTAKAVIKAMLAAGVLLGPDGREIPAGITAQASMVAGLREGFRDSTEAYLVEFLIRRIGDISARDHTALAHALFRQFDPNVPLGDLEDRLVVLLARLADRVEMQPDDAYCIRDSRPE